MENETLVAENDASSNNKSLLSIATESWRFAKVFESAIAKLDSTEQVRYVNKYRFYIKQLENILSSEGLRLVNLEGHQFDPGTAAVALNLDEFQPADVLIIDQMLEPLIMNDDGIVKTATVLLRKVDL